MTGLAPPGGQAPPGTKDRGQETAAAAGKNGLVPQRVGAQPAALSPQEDAEAAGGETLQELRFQAL